MEAELEGMLVGGWVQGDRAKLFLRVEAMERQLSLMTSSRKLEREACEMQKTGLTRRMAKAEEECRDVVKELSLRVKGEEKLRRICQRRIQELEAEAVLLCEQLKVAEAKFREVEMALERERSSNASRKTRVRSDAARPADEARRKDGDRPACVNDASNRRVFRPPVPGSGGCECGAHVCDCGTAAARVPSEAGVETEELGVVKKLVTGLLEENLRLGSTVEELQCCREVSPLSMAGAPTRTERAKEDNIACAASGKIEQDTAVVAGKSPREDVVKSTDEAVPSNRAVSSSAMEWGAQEGRGSQDPKAENDGVPGSEIGIAEGMNMDVATALSKIKALTGMVRAQEGIETLLGQELVELKNEAKDRERLWKLLLRWKQVLEAKGYTAEHDIREAGLLAQIRQRVAAEIVRS